VSRFENWPTLLSAFLDARRQARFCYGAHDCCLFVADALRVITGVDFAAQFRNRYNTAFGALRRLRESTASASVDATAGRIFAAHGLPAIPPGYAQRGDVLALSLAREGVVLSLVSLDGMPIIAAERGWGISDRACALKAWKV
jgi:uncharacterized protein DUF6950